MALRVSFAMTDAGYAAELDWLRKLAKGLAEESEHEPDLATWAGTTEWVTSRLMPVADTFRADWARYVRITDEMTRRGDLP